MNKADVINKIVEKTNLPAAMCEEILKAFEEQAGDVLANKLTGKQTGGDAFADAVAATTGHSPQDCEKVLNAIDETLDEGLSDKLRFFKRKKQ